MTENVECDDDIFSPMFTVSEGDSAKVGYARKRASAAKVNPDYVSKTPRKDRFGRKLAKPTIEVLSAPPTGTGGRSKARGKTPKPATVVKPKKRINSRNKGKCGELELAKHLIGLGFDGARRGQQFSGGSDSPDVVCASLPGIHIECKRVEQGNLYTWLAQAQRDCGKNVPVVMHRRSKQKWVVILPLDQFLKMIPKPK